MDEQTHKGHSYHQSYLRNGMSKPQTDDKFNKLVDCFAQLYKHEHSNVMELERKDTVAVVHTIQAS